MLTSLLWRLSRTKGGFSRWLRDEAALYIDFYDDQGYDLQSNGEADLLEQLKPFSIETVVDVGANVGDWSKMALSHFPNATVYAFELSESTRNLLRDTLPRDRVVIPDAALGDESKIIAYKDYGHLSTVNTIVSTAYHDAQTSFVTKTARLLTGDEFMAMSSLRTIDLLKIDVEGAEMLVLKGFRDALMSQRIRAIQFEYGYANGDAGHLMKHFYELFDQCHYRVGKIWSKGVRFCDFEYRMNNFDSGPNYLAVANKETAMIDRIRSSV